VAPDTSTFRLTASAGDFPRYVPTFLANGYVSSVSSPRGTDATLTLVAALMDRTAGDVSRPAAIPSWAEIDVFNGTAWLNQTPVTAATFHDYAQTLEMRDGVLTTSYTWTAGGRAARVEVSTFISQSAFHLAATRLVLVPQFTGRVHLRFPLRAWPAQARRLPMARLSWEELRDALDGSEAIRPLPASTPRPERPREIRTWFDLQDALAADGLALALPDEAAPTRAAIWYPGAVAIRPAASLSDLTLGVHGAALNGSAFAEAVAVELPPALPVLGTRVVREAPDGGVTIEVEAEVQAGHAYPVVKYVSVSRDGWGGGLTDDLARAAEARAGGFDALRRSHTAAWHNLWTSDITVEGDPTLQRVIHSELFYLLQSTNPETSWPVGACGLSPHYFGHVFWDCDNWVFPVLLLLHPERARHLVAFRSRTLPWARANAQRQGLAGAAFPWEADPETGAEETPRYARVNAEREIHLQGDIAIAQWQYYLATDDREWLREHGFPVIEAAADYYAARAAYDAAHGRYELRHVVSVDEKYTDVDNDAYTNAVAWTCLDLAVSAAEVLGVPPHRGWDAVSGTLAPLLSAERRHLMFGPAVPHDRRTWMAGALALLTAPYLDLPMPEDVRRNDYAYAVRQVDALTVEPNQMMLGMLAVHAATLGDGAAAHRWLQPAELEFLKPPFNVRSETPHNNTMHHLAASCGILQALVYGFSGLRITEKGLVGAYAPVLPDHWGALTLEGVRFRGRTFDVRVARRGGRGDVRLTGLGRPDAPARPRRAR
jgi:trehalose/maltose hydrolase-like predicted phosphorylase